VGVLTASVIKPTFGSATNAGPKGSYDKAQLTSGCGWAVWLL
jgi:hypothetical protein